ncbi:hypothetical protein [Dietzia maris]|uniref:ABC transporter permease n=1 Tax=Dietzia maris TaxID=37915 RepID=A0ABT8H333_9ACTN|nr:hypothetical protein [Dietzia maris]MBB0997730.1 hypothetical protein [Dietzia maris]MDN4506875.1 hypothetical protein [Dietzia maris]
MNATTTSLDGPVTERNPSTAWAARIPAAFRLQFVVPSNLLIVPTAVFLLVWAVAIGITFWIDALADGRVAAEEPMYGGASQAAVWTLGFMAAYTVTQTLPFAMALSFSRRTFVVGAYLAFAAVSAGFGTAYALAAWVERVTDGFGIHAYQFDTPFMTSSHGLFGAGVLAAALAFAVMVLAFLFAGVFRRVSVLGFWTLMVALLAAIGAVVLILGQNAGWAGIGQWFLAQTALTGSAYFFGVAVVAAVLGYLVLRRATPTS